MHNERELENIPPSVFFPLGNENEPREKQDVVMANGFCPLFLQMGLNLLPQSPLMK